MTRRPRDAFAGTGTVQVGLVHGFGLTQDCAIASTVAHDSHQMIVVGTDDESMTAAANHLAATGGGQVVVEDDHPRSVRNMAGDDISRLAAQIGIEDQPPLRRVNGRQEGRVDPLDRNVLHREPGPHQGLSEDGARRNPVGVVVVDQGDRPARPSPR